MGIERTSCSSLELASKPRDPYSRPTTLNNQTHAMKLEFPTNQGHETMANVIWGMYNHERTRRLDWTRFGSIIRKKLYKTK